RLLGDRRVAHAPRAEFLQQAHRRLEHAAGAGHVLAQEHDVLVALHLLGDAACTSVAIGQFRHAKRPSAYPSVVRISSGGIGAALEASVASSTILRTSLSILATALSSTPNCLSRSR